MKDKTLGMIIAELRKKQGMTQLDLGNKMGITDKAISKWERDLSCPDVSSLPHLAEVLKISVDELVQHKVEAIPKKPNVRELISLIFKSVAMAMGIAVLVLSILNKLDIKSGITMLGIGLTSIGLYTFQDKE